MARVTVVNDNPEFLELAGDILEDDRYTTTLIDGDLPDALERIVASEPDVLMIDLRMGTDQLHGWEVAQEVRRHPRLEHLPILVCSGDAEALNSISDQLDDTRSVGVLLKPFSIDALSESIDRLLSQPIS